MYSIFLCVSIHVAYSRDTSNFMGRNEDAHIAAPAIPGTMFLETSHEDESSVPELPAGSREDHAGHQEDVQFNEESKPASHPRRVVDEKAVEVAMRGFWSGAHGCGTTTPGQTNSTKTKEAADED